MKVLTCMGSRPPANTRNKLPPKKKTSLTGSSFLEKMSQQRSCHTGTRKSWKQRYFERKKCLRDTTATSTMKSTPLTLQTLRQFGSTLSSTVSQLTMNSSRTSRSNQTSPSLKLNLHKPSSMRTWKKWLMTTTGP